MRALSGVILWCVLAIVVVAAPVSATMYEAGTITSGEFTFLGGGAYEVGSRSEYRELPRLRSSRRA